MGDLIIGCIEAFVLVSFAMAFIGRAKKGRRF